MSSEKIGLFYGSSTCYTEMAAEKISLEIGQDRVDIFNIADTEISQTENYRLLIMGIPTWDYGELQEDWEAIWEDIAATDFQGKLVAIFGLGDQVGYPQWFQDALGYLHDQLVLRGAKLVGYWPADGYEFEASKALTQDETHFVGLPLDEENEFDLSQDRIQAWCKMILSEFDEQ